MSRAKIPNHCTVCRHPDRPKIERAIVDKVPLRRIGERYGLDKSSLHRHAHSHMAEALRQAELRRQAREGYNSLTLLERLQTLSTATLKILGEALNTRRLSDANTAICQARRNLRFEGELLGQLRSGQNVHSEVKLNVVYGSKEDGNICSNCRQVIDWQEQQNQHNLAIRRALGVVPTEGEAPTTETESRQGETGTVPAGVDGEMLGSFKINRQQSEVISARIVRPDGKPAEIPPRPALPPHQQPNLLGVVTNKSFFDFKRPL